MTATTRVWSLIKSQIKVAFGLSAAKFYYIRKRRRLWEAVLIPFSIGIAALSIGFGVYKFAAAFYSAYAGLGQGDVTLLLGILACQTLTLVLGFALVLGNFYYANDLPLLVPLPLRPWEALTGKFAVLLIGEYAVLGVFFLPVLLTYGINSQVSALPFILIALPIFLTLPLIPLSLAAIPAVLLMRVLGHSKRKDLLLIVAGFLFIILILVGQMYFQGRLAGNAGNEAEFLQRILATAHGLTNLLGRMFPPAAWAARALAEPVAGLPYFLLFLGLSGLGLLCFFLIGNAVFYQGVLRGGEVGRSSRQKRTRALSRAGSKALSPVAGLARTEFFRFIRTPIYVLNGFAGFIIFPIIFLVPGALTSTSELTTALNALRNGPMLGTMSPLIVAAYFVIMTVMVTAPFTAFSREGRRNIWILKALPGNGAVFTKAKVRGALWMIIPGALPGLAAIQWLLRLPWTGLALGMVLGVMVSYLLCWLGVLIDLARPMLDWVSQEKPVKANLNVIIGLALGAGLIAGAAFGIAALLRTGLPAWGVIAVVSGVLAVLAAAAHRTLPSVAIRLWHRLEV